MGRLLRGGNGSADGAVEPLRRHVEAFSGGFLNSATGTADQILEVKRCVLEEVAEEVEGLGVQQAADQLELGYYLHLICD